MLDALQSLLPSRVPIHHLGLYREKTTLNPVEYYNNLPFHRTSQQGDAEADKANTPSDLAIIVDPIIATGATACAAIETLRDWGAKRILVLCVLASEGGLRKVCEMGQERDLAVWAGGCDGETDERGMIKPGLGDVGDRLFMTVGK